MGHIPVLFTESLDLLCIKPDGVYVDMTIGGFGHGKALCEQLSEHGSYIGIDLDMDAIERASQYIDRMSCHMYLFNDSYHNIDLILSSLDIDKVDGCLLDMGVSSFQLDEASRGFSFVNEGPLDMRMNTNAEKSAWNVINEYPESEIRHILQVYGEERYAGNIAKKICLSRKNKSIDTTLELAEIVRQSIPPTAVKKGRNPATKTFQAIRIEVNDELDGLERVIGYMIDHLKPGGRICAISFHSLEDRAVKTVFNERAKGCICPKEFPVCVCGHEPEIKILTKTPIEPTLYEQNTNARSRSAKLRCAEKI